MSFTCDRCHTHQPPGTKPALVTTATRARPVNREMEIVKQERRCSACKGIEEGTALVGVG